MTRGSESRLDAAKFKVIAAMEQRLPAYAKDQWAEPGEGRDWSAYVPRSGT